MFFMFRSTKSFDVLQLKPLFHVLIPKMMATIILTAGSTTPIAIVPAVLKPPPVLPPSDGIVEGTGCEKDEACDEEVADVATASREVVLRVE